MPRTHMIPSDPFVADRIRDTLAEAPEERPKPNLPKPKPLELLMKWKIEAAKAHGSTATPSARATGGWRLSRPGAVRTASVETDGGRPCSVCSSPQLAAINKELLVLGGSKSTVAARYGLTESSVQRHRANCLAYRRRERKPGRPVECAEPGGIVRFDPEDPKSLVETTARLVDDALSLLENSKRSDDNRTALAALREARDGLKLLMQNAGMLAGDGSTVIDNRRQTVNIASLTTDDLRSLARLAPAIDADFSSSMPSRQQRAALSSDARRRAS